MGERRETYHRVVLDLLDALALRRPLEAAVDWLSVQLRDCPVRVGVGYVVVCLGIVLTFVGAAAFVSA